MKHIIPYLAFLAMMVYIGLILHCLIQIEMAIRPSKSSKKRPLWATFVLEFWKMPDEGIILTNTFLTDEQIRNLQIIANGPSSVGGPITAPQTEPPRIPLGSRVQLRSDLNRFGVVTGRSGNRLCNVRWESGPSTLAYNTIGETAMHTPEHQLLIISPPPTFIVNDIVRWRNDSTRYYQIQDTNIDSDGASIYKLDEESWTQSWDIALVSRNGDTSEYERRRALAQEQQRQAREVTQARLIAQLEAERLEIERKAAARTAALIEKARLEEEAEKKHLVELQAIENKKQAVWEGLYLD